LRSRAKAIDDCIASLIELRVASLKALQPSYGASNDDYAVIASVKNKSKSKVTAVLLNTTALDCPTQDARTTDCEVVGRSDQTFGTDIPAGEARRINGKIILPNMPDPRGVLSPRFAVEGVRAAIDQSDDTDWDDLLGRLANKCDQSSPRADRVNAAGQAGCGGELSMSRWHSAQTKTPPGTMECAIRIFCALRRCALSRC